MSAFEYMACAGWANLNDFRVRYPDMPDEATDDIITDDLAIATEVLYNLSGRQFMGSCTVTLRPEPSVRESRIGLQEIDLGLWPVTAVSAVTIDGVTIDPSLYRVDHHRYLVYLPGAGPDYTANYWPLSQALDRPSTAPGTFEVTASYGFGPPVSGKRAALSFAYELVLDDVGDECKLPERVRSISRSGLTQDVVSAEDFLDKMRTGITEVDRFIAAFNPKNLLAPTYVFSPDTQPDRRRVQEFPHAYTGRGLGTSHWWGTY